MNLLNDQIKTAAKKPKHPDDTTVPAGITDVVVAKVKDFVR